MLCGCRVAVALIVISVSGCSVCSHSANRLSSVTINTSSARFLRSLLTHHSAAPPRSVFIRLLCLCMLCVCVCETVCTRVPITITGSCVDVCAERGNKSLPGERCGDEGPKKKKERQEVKGDAARSRGQSLCGVTKCLTQVGVFRKGFRRREPLVSL